jgi:hypothetical protein
MVAPAATVAFGYEAGDLKGMGLALYRVAQDDANRMAIIKRMAGNIFRITDFSPQTKGFRFLVSGISRACMETSLYLLVP